MLRVIWVKEFKKKNDHITIRIIGIISIEADNASYAPRKWH